MLSAAPSTHLKSPTVIATRYDDIFAVVENFIVCCVTAGPGTSDSTCAVGDRGVAAIDRQRDGERRLERRLVEARKRAARVGRLELRDRVLPELGLADVEAAQLRVQDAAELDVDLGRALRRAASATVSVAVWSASSSVTVAVCAAAPAPIVTSWNWISTAFSTTLDVGSRHLDANRLGAVEPLAGQVDDERQVVVRRR